MKIEERLRFWSASVEAEEVDLDENISDAGHRVCDALIFDLNEAVSRIAELEKDRERMNAIESNGWSVSEEDDHDDCTRWVVREEPEGKCVAFGMSFRAAIDAAMQAEDNGVEIGPRVAVTDSRDEWEKGPGK